MRGFPFIYKSGLLTELYWLHFWKKDIVKDSLSTGMFCERLFLVLILSLKKSFEKIGRIWGIKWLKYNLLVKFVYLKSPFGLELLYFESLTSRREVTNRCELQVPCRRTRHSETWDNSMQPICFLFAFRSIYGIYSTYYA